MYMNVFKASTQEYKIKDKLMVLSSFWCCIIYMYITTSSYSKIWVLRQTYIWFNSRTEESTNLQVWFDENSKGISYLNCTTNAENFTKRSVEGSTDTVQLITHKPLDTTRCNVQTIHVSQKQREKEGWTKL